MLGVFSIFIDRSRFASLGWAILIGLTIAGCKKPAEITRYQVPKEKAVVTAPPDTGSADTGSPNNTDANSPGEAQPAASKKPGQDRMLAAIVPRGERAWFFKLAGDADAVGKQAEEFDAVLKSVKFPESAGGDPEWKLPEGWKQLPGSQFRFATLLAPAEDGAKPLELTVTTLPWDSANEQGAILSNVNRWRGQVSLADLTADELDKNIREENLPAGKAIFVDLKGTLKEGGMRPPFAPRPNGTEK